MRDKQADEEPRGFPVFPSPAANTDAPGKQGDDPENPFRSSHSPGTKEGRPEETNQEQLTRYPEFDQN